MKIHHLVLSQILMLSLPIDAANRQFTSEESVSILQNRLGGIIEKILATKKIVLPGNEQLIAFAIQIRDSGLTFAELEDRVVRYIGKDTPPFTALTRAIAREKFARFKTRRNQEVLNENGVFMRALNQLGLAAADRKKVENAFAMCIDSFRQPQNRRRMQPAVCEPLNDYQTPRCHKTRVSVKEKKSLKPTNKSLAYSALVAEAKDVAEQEELDIFEKVMMAKCIADQSLRFFEPSAKPLRALKKTWAMNRKSPDEAFFMKSGVCGNFSGIAYNLGNELGLGNQIFLTKTGLHIYLEFRVGQTWYHTHPLSSMSDCDIIKFNSDPPN